MGRPGGRQKGSASCRRSSSGRSSGRFATADDAIAHRVTVPCARLSIVIEWAVDYPDAMSNAAPTPVEPPAPSAEQLAEWRALVERVRQGDRSEVVPWDEVADELGL
jgi:hypothetical protein